MGVEVRAPMSGLVIEVSVEAGQAVREDDTLVVLEAMKMEVPIVAPASGTVTEIKVKPQDAVTAEQVIMVLS